MRPSRVEWTPHTMTHAIENNNALDPAYNETTPPPTPDAWQPFEGLKRLAPELAEMATDVRYQTPPPKPMPRDPFLAFAACFACPRRRAVLRALILDLLAEDIADLLSTDEEQGE